MNDSLHPGSAVDLVFKCKRAKKIRAFLLLLVLKYPCFALFINRSIVSNTSCLFRPCCQGAKCSPSRSRPQCLIPLTFV